MVERERDEMEAFVMQLPGGYCQGANTGDQNQGQHRARHGSHRDLGTGQTGVVHKPKGVVKDR